MIHVGLVGAGLLLFSRLLLTHLGLQLLVQFLVLGPLFVLIIDVLEVRLLVLLDALLNVLLLLFELELLIVVADGIAHAVHDGLDAAAALSHGSLARLLLLKGHFHVLFDLLRVLLLYRLDLGHSLLFLVHVLFYHFHCSLTLFNLLVLLVTSLFFDIGSQLCDSSFLFTLSFELLIDLFLFDLLKHDVAHLLLFNHLSLQLHFLLTLLVHFFPRLIEDSLIKLFPLLFVFLSEFSSKFDLLVENFTHLLHSVLVVSLLLSHLFLVETLAELLNLTPLVVADVRWHVLHLDNLVSSRDASSLGNAAKLS